MSRSLLRLLAVAVLALALPLQGLAAVAAMQCMAFGHHQPGGDGHAHDHGDADGHDHAAHSHGDEGAAHQGNDDGKGAHCGPCTACCASASIAGPAPLALLPAASDSKYFFSQLAPPGVQPDGLDRPPLAL